MTGRGRPRQFSLTEVIEAALDLIEAEGVQALSMQAVAKRLGTGSATLYNYVQGRDELIDLMLGHVLAEQPEVPATTGDWTERVVQYLLASFRAGITRPAVLQLWQQRPQIHLGAAVRTEEELRLLEAIGFSTERAVEVYRILSAQLHGHISVAAALMVRPDSALADPATKLGQAQQHADLVGEERLYESAVRAVVQSLAAELEGARA
jgi:AcrR family transcriptional regulator